jgi:hypothetical protein
LAISGNRPTQRLKRLSDVSGEEIAVRIMRAVAAGAILAVTTGAGVAAAAPELATTDQLKTRRYVSAGDRAYVMGFQDGRFYAQGWHVTGEMGGVWTQPLKLVDGVWFGINGQWLAPAKKFTSGWGYTRMDFPDAAGLKVSRTTAAAARCSGCGCRTPAPPRPSTSRSTPTPR